MIISQSNIQSLPSFEFYKAAYLIEATALRATSLSQLLTGVTLADVLSVFHHLHRRFFVHPELLFEYPNDFAQWVGAELGNWVMAEQLANVNLFRAATLHDVRREITIIVANHLAHNGDGRQTSADRAFVFCLPRLVVLSCGCQAATPRAFLSILRTVEHASIAYHLFTPKIMSEDKRNNFAAWFAIWGYDALAQQLDSFDPYLNDLEESRGYLIQLIAAGVGEHDKGGSDA
jgi:hypothetical protein